MRRCPHCDHPLVYLDEVKSVLEVLPVESELDVVKLVVEERLDHDGESVIHFDVVLSNAQADTLFRGGASLAAGRQIERLGTELRERANRAGLDQPIIHTYWTSSEWKRRQR